MTGKRKKKPKGKKKVRAITRPRHETDLLCPDCASEVEYDHDAGTMTVWLRHSPSCPAWRHPARQFLLQMHAEPTTEPTADQTQDQA